MYGWIWRKLPGNAWLKSFESFLLAIGLVALLWFVVFPLLTPVLPFDDVQVEGGNSEPATSDGDAPPTFNEDDYEIQYDIPTSTAE